MQATMQEQGSMIFSALSITLLGKYGKFHLEDEETEAQRVKMTSQVVQQVPGGTRTCSKVYLAPKSELFSAISNSPSILPSHLGAISEQDSN